MGRKAVFIDKDGTLIPDIPYNVDPDLITIDKATIEGLQLLRDMGYALVVISNQSGVAKGLFREEDLKQVFEKISKLLDVFEVKMEGYYYCPHLPEGTVAAYAVRCECRKPMPGLLLKAAQDLGIDLERSWMIGDILNDVEAGNRAGCRTILINNGNETEWLTADQREPHAIVNDVKDAAIFIMKKRNNEGL